MNLRKPGRSTLADAGALLDVLIGFYDAIVEFSGALQPERVPNLKSVTLSTHAQLRSTRGDIAGELGPRLTMVAGGTAVLDGGEGVFAWDPDSTLADNGATVFQVGGIDRGRWRKAAM